MTNPLDTYFIVKHAGKIPNGIKKTASPMSIGGQLSSTFGGSMIQGVGTAAAAAGIAGVGLAANNVFNAVTKARDFKSMLASPFNDDLKDHYLQDPRRFNAAFTSIRTMTPEFSKDPIVAGNYMRQMMTGGDMSAGGTLVGALREGSKDKSPFSDMLSAAAIKGIEGGQKGQVSPKDMWAAQRGPAKEGPSMLHEAGNVLKSYAEGQAADAAKLRAAQAAAQSPAAPGPTGRRRRP